MRRSTVLALAGLLCASGSLLAQQGQLRQLGRAVIEYRSPSVNAVAAYEYSRRNHDGAWLLVELAVLARERIAIDRNQISLLTPKEEVVPVATQRQFLEDHEAINQLLQSATVSRRPIGLYFTTRLQPTIRFFAFPGSVVHDTFVTNRDEAAGGDVLFKSPQGRWEAGTYILRINHPEAQAQLPIELE